MKQAQGPHRVPDELPSPPGRPVLIKCQNTAGTRRTPWEEAQDPTFKASPKNAQEACGTMHIPHLSVTRQ